MYLFASRWDLASGMAPSDPEGDLKQMPQEMVLVGCGGYHGPPRAHNKGRRLSSKIGVITFQKHAFFWAKGKQWSVKGYAMVHDD